MMTLFTFWMLGATLFCFQVVNDPPSETGDPQGSPAVEETRDQEIARQIDEAIANLDSEVYVEREQAAKLLWNHGERAKAALAKVVETGSLEASGRARRILADVELGITPEATIDHAAFMRLFGTSSHGKRAEMALERIKEGDFELVPSMIERIDDVAVKQKLFRLTVENTPILVHLIEGQRLGWWIQKGREAGVDFDRHSIVVSWLREPKNLRDLRDADQLGIIESVFLQEPHDASRFALAKLLLSDRSFGEFVTAETNLDLLLHIIDLPTIPASREELLLILIRESKPATIFQADSYANLMRFVKEQGPAASIDVIKLALLDLVASHSDASNYLTVEVYCELSTGLADDDFARMFSKAMTQHAFTRWIYETDHFRPLLDWATTLSVESRNHWIQVVNADLSTRQAFAEQLLGEPSTLEVYWRLLDALPSDEAREQAKFRMARIIAMETHARSEQRKELVDSVMKTHTAEADIAFADLLSDHQYVERVYDRSESVQLHFHRCALVRDVHTQNLLPEAFKTLFSANSLRDHFRSDAHSEWLLDEYVPSLPKPIRYLVVSAMCGSERLVQTWQGKRLTDQLLTLAQDQPDPSDRLFCIASILRYASFVALAKDAPQAKLVTLYSDETLPEEARTAFASRLLSNPSFLNWLSDSGHAADWIAFVERLAADREKDLPPVYCSPAFVTLLVNQDRLGPWMMRIDGDEKAERLALAVILQQPTLMTPEFFGQHLERLLRWADSISNSHERSTQLHAMFFSPPAIALHKQNRSFNVVLDRIAAEEDRDAQGNLLRGLGQHDVMNALTDSGELDALVGMIKSLPSERRASALSLVTSRALLKHLEESDQVDWLFDLVTTNTGNSRLHSHESIIELLIRRGYIDRLMHAATTSKDREELLLELLSSYWALSVYARDGRLGELVKLFNTLEPGMARDEAIYALFQDPEHSLAVCKELGTTEAISLASTIEYPRYVSEARANALIAASSLEKLSTSLLRQLLTDSENSGGLWTIQRQRLVQGDVGEQLIAAGLLPQLKEVFLKTNPKGSRRPKEPLDDYYSSELVLKHLRDSGNVDEVVEHARSIVDPNERSQFLSRLVESDTGCRILLTGEVFPKFVSVVETMSVYSQSKFWGSFCVSPAVIRHVSATSELDALWQYLMNRKQTKQEIEWLVVLVFQSDRLDRVVRNRVLMGHLVADVNRFHADTKVRVALKLARSPGAIWALVESDQWDSLVALLECEANPEGRLSRWQMCASPQSGLMSALVGAKRYDLVNEVFRKIELTPSEAVWNELRLELASGRCDDRIKDLESGSNSLDGDGWRSLALRYRAFGDDAKALDAARKANDHGLVVALAIERGDWAEVATLLSQLPAPLAHIQPPDDEAGRLEHQAMLLVSRLFANQSEQLQTPIDAIRDLRVKTKSLRVGSRCCDALILGGQTDEALAFMDKHIVHRALRLRLHRGEYAAAIAAVKWDTEDPHAFLKAMRASSGSDSVMIQAAVELLSALRGEQLHHDMQTLHEAVMKSTTVPENGNMPGQKLGNYAHLLYRHELDELFWNAVESMEPHAIMNSVFAMDKHDKLDRDFVVELERLLQSSTGSRVNRVDKESAIAALRATEQLLRHKTFPKERLDAWVEEIASRPEAWQGRAEEAIVVGTICMRQGRFADATRILAPLAADHAKAKEALARQAWRDGDWQQAALHYEQLNQLSRERIDAMYLRGLALLKAGDKESGQQAMTRAIEIAYYPQTQFQIALELRFVGETERANEIARRVVRSVPHHGQQHLDAIAFLKENVESPEERAHWCQQWMLCQTRHLYGNGDQTEYLRVPQTLRDAQKSLISD